MSARAGKSGKSDEIQGAGIHQIFQIFIPATTGESGKSDEFQLPGFHQIFQIFRSALRKSGKSDEIQLLVYYSLKTRESETHQKEQT